MKTVIKGLKKRPVPKKTTSRQHDKIYRLSSDLVNQLVQSLTRHDETHLATVRYATEHPWILQDSYQRSETKDSPQLHEPGGPVSYLKCATVGNEA